MSTAVAIATELSTGALVLTLNSTRRLRSLAQLRRSVARALDQRPGALIIDLCRLPARWALPAVAVSMAQPRQGVRLVACAAPAVRRALRVVPCMTVYSSARRALAALPGFHLPPARRVRARLRPTADAAREARTLVAEALSAWRVGHLDLAAQLIASELVTNAVEHARTDVDFHLTRIRDGVCIAVRDKDPSMPAASARREVGGRIALRGRGLKIVAQTAQRWGCLTGTQDKIVWAALRDGQAEMRAAA